jgi:hypothetical protein
LLLKSALIQVIERSKILRTTFIPWKRTFLQVVNSSITLPWTTITDKNLQHFLQDPSGDEMSLDGPLIRAAILNDEYLILEMHHALFDFWSSQFIIDDAVRIMKHGATTIPRRLQYNSFVAYQQAQDNVEVQAFWKEYLDSSTPTVLELGNGSTGTSFSVTHDLGTSLVDFSQKAGVGSSFSLL